MGSIEPYDTIKGRRYRVLYRRPDHLQTSKRGFRTKLDAQTFLASIEVDKATGRYVDPAMSRATVSAWMKRWLATRPDLRATTRTRIEGIITNYIDPELGRIPIGGLNRLRVRRAAKGLRAPLHPHPRLPRRCIARSNERAQRRRSSLLRQPDEDLAA